MVYAYDRDANPFYFPKDVGVRLGPGSPYTRLVQEWHYLIPKAGIKHRFTDHTRFRLLLTSRLRPHNAAMLGMMNMSMRLPAGQDRYHHSFVCPASKVKLMLKNDWAKEQGKVQPFAVHLHAHTNGKKLWWQHLRNGKVIGEYGRFNHYGGYGPHQSFMHLHNTKNPKSIQGDFTPGDGASLQKSDSLRINCEFDTTGFKNIVKYGTNHGEEMCGFLMMYYPHDWTKIKHHEDACLFETGANEW